jgi:hypothetical protein
MLAFPNRGKCPSVVRLFPHIRVRDMLNKDDKGQISEVSEGGKSRWRAVRRSAL